MLAERESRDFASAAEIYLDLVEFGHLYGHGGTIIDFLSGSGVANSGCQCLAKIPRVLTREQDLHIVTRLSETETLIEPLGDLLRRDSVHVQHYLGWLGHLHYEFERSGLFVSYDTEGTMELIYKRHLAYLRLLQAKYALRAWHAEDESWPPSLQELVPGYLPQTLIDPYSSEEHSLRYRNIGSDYLLYSVGANGLDEGGKHHEFDANGIRKFDTGDLTIEDSLLGGR